MGAGAETVFCDMTTSGGGWTLVARSAPGGTSSGNFGWYGVEGAVSNVSAPYSIGVLNKNLPFTQILFGDAPGNANAWGAHINMNNASRATLVANQSTNVWIGVPTAISSSASTGFAMADYMGFTSVDTNIYYFRDVTPNAGYGLAAWGWDTAYGNGTSDVGGQAFGASYGGFINNSQGLLMVR
jgi:hypothetical protein